MWRHKMSSLPFCCFDIMSIFRKYQTMILPNWPRKTCITHKKEPFSMHLLCVFQCKIHNMYLCMWNMTYLIENRAAEADMNVMSKTDRAMRILVKLLRNWISFLLRTKIERPLPKRPIRTVMGVTTTSMILAKVNSMVDEVGDLLDLQCHTKKGNID